MPTDAEVVEMMRAHHAQLADGLRAKAEAVEQAGGTEPAVLALVAYLRSDILPHAAAEEVAVYPRAARLAGHEDLIASMVAEHRLIEGDTSQLAETRGPLAVTLGNSLSALFASHADKENELILPALVADPETSLDGVLREMHAALH